jgi:coenzyme F420-reducing hydrogenase delta subunit
MAGSMRLNYPSNVLITEMPCTGRVDVLHLMKTFEQGVDGVLVAGCLEGSCHYLKGNIQAKRRVKYTKNLLESIGVGEDRLEMFNLSSSEGPRFAQIANEMTDRIKELGPTPVAKRG